MISWIFSFGKVRTLIYIFFFAGILNGQTGHFNKTYCFDFCGKDFRDNYTPVDPIPNEYSTHLYARRTIDIIKHHKSSKVSRPTLDR